MLAVRAARLFDGTGARPGRRVMVLVDDGRIAAVDTTGADPPAGAKVVDLGDATLLPGLIDTHVHLGFDASADPVGHLVAADDPTLALRMRDAARRSLAAGVTTVRDLGDRRFLGVALREWFRSGAEPGPEILASGPPLTAPGGHCHFLGGEVAGEAEVGRAVRRWVEQGVDVIKVMASGGELTPGTDPLRPQFTTGEVRAAVAHAHRLGRKVTAHAHGALAVDQVVQARVDGIEHCTFRVAGPDLVRAGQEALDRLAALDVTVCPTIGTLPGVPLPPRLVPIIEAFRPVVARMHHAGVRLVAGSDAGVGPSKPHGVLPHTLIELATLGLTGAEALASATSVAADVCGVADRKGALTPGRDADIVAVRGDPSEDLRALLDVGAVFRAGVRVGGG